MARPKQSLLAGLLDVLTRHKCLRQTLALFIKNVLVAWRNKWATILRLLAPLVFLTLALMVQEGLQANTRRTGRTRATPVSTPQRIASIPDCSSDLFINDKPCLNFVFTPFKNEVVRTIVAAVLENNDPPIPFDRVLGFNTRNEADEFIQNRNVFVMGAVHFHESDTGRLQYIVQSNTTVASFKGYVQSPNNFFQLPFMSAIAREVSRYYLQAQGRLQDAELLDWQPQLATFPHPELSPGAAGYLLPPFVFLACMFSTVSMISMLVSEKETGLRQALRTMGLVQGSYWFSWWLFEAVMAAVNAWVVTGFGIALRLALFRVNDPRLLFLLFWLFGLAMTSFACCISVFMNTTASAYNGSLVMIVVGWMCQALAAFGLPYAPTLLYSPTGVGQGFFWVFAMLPWNPLTKGILDLAAAAANPHKQGLKFSERNSYCRYVPDPSKDAVSADMAWLYLEDNCVFSLEKCYYTLLIQAAGWLLAALYLDNVRPDKHGVKLPLWYPLLPSYWIGAVRTAAAGRSHTSSSATPAAAGKTPEVHSTVGKAYKTPFAGSDINRKVAKSFMDRDDRGLVIRCSSSSAGGMADHSSRVNAAAASAITLDNRVQRCSASSGNLRRREVRSTFSDAGEATNTEGAGAAARNAIQQPVTVQPSMQPAKHDDEAGAAASAAMSSKKCSKSAESANTRCHKEIPAALGLVPVVLDPGVLQEERRMKEIWYSDVPWTAKQDIVQVFGLRKVYKMPRERKKCCWLGSPVQYRQQSLAGSQPKHHCKQQRRQFIAVADSWFGVAKGQLLCLLGPNGAGKTTTINCMTGALPSTGGDIRVMGRSLLVPGGLEVAQAVMGVCPQFDVLWDELSGYEHMYIYGCIKGLRLSEVAQHSSQLLEQVQLTAAAAKRSSSYSGGMKRRLSVALALLGSPQLVFLDEPTTGMDPISRRAVWDAISAAKQHAALVLTTHSMEEADALGDRIGIMVRGRMRVLGGSLSLKQKYGNGYQLRLRLKDTHPGAQLATMLSLQSTAGGADWQQLQPHPTAPWMGAGVPQHLQSQLQPGLSEQNPSATRALVQFFERVQSAMSGSIGVEYFARSRRGRRSTSAAGAEVPLSAGGHAADPAVCSNVGWRVNCLASQPCLQDVVAQFLGLTPAEEGRQMLHYVVPHELAPQLQQLLDMLDMSEGELGLAEVHVSLATLEEVFLAVVKQAEQDYAAMHGRTVMIELPGADQQLEVPVGQEAAVDAMTGNVYAVEWVQDEWGKLAVLGVRLMEQHEQQRYWQQRQLP
eukprot:gene4500-4753_t